MRYLFICLLVSGLITSCSGPKSTHTSILVIAVEGLGFESMGCDQSQHYQEMGFKSFCEESIRFTHAYTPSTSTQATLASLLTGLYPHDHKVHHNGADFLSAKFETVAEVALKKGYETFFSSGGVPIFSKSGIDQGFLSFLDSPKIKGKVFYRPASEVVQSFLKWKEDNSGPSFSVLYLNDTQFPWVTTKNKRGEPRAKGKRSQLAEISESLEHLIAEMKKDQSWNTTHVFLLGTSGEQSKLHDELPQPLNLYSEHTQVALHVKPTRRLVDGGIQWKVDSNVSLVDVGFTFFDFFQTKRPSGTLPELRRQSLLPLLVGKEVSIDDDRVLLTESDWATQHKKGSRLVALRKGHILYMNSSPTKIYNSLVDRQEVSSISKEDPTIKADDLYVFEEIIESLGLDEWDIPDPKFIAKIQLAARLWSEKNFSQEVYVPLFHLIKKNPNDEQLAGWLAQKLIKESKWMELFSLGGIVSNSYWKKLGAANLGRRFPIIPLGCQKVFVDNFKLVKISARECDDELLLNYINWQTEPDAGLKRLQWVQFLNKFRALRNSRNVSRGNHVNYLNWGSDIASLSGPNLLELYLLLPANSGQLHRFLRELKRSSVKLSSESLFLQFK